MSTITRLRRIVPVVTIVAGLAAVSIGAATGQGADPFVAGGPSTRAVPLAATQVDRARALGRQLAAALGLPGVSQRVERLDDRFEHRTYDEVTAFDASNRAVAIARFETDGSVAMAVVLGWQPGRGAPVDRASAEQRGRSFVRAAGLVADGQPEVRPTGSGGWMVSWSRVAAGVPIRGDGIRVSLWADGTFHGLTRTERTLAALPDRQISAGAARLAAANWANARFPATAGGMHVASVERAWVAPNGMFSANGLDAPAETLRLAWVVRFETTGPLVERLRSVEVWLDAGDTTVLGGDVIE